MTTGKPGPTMLRADDKVMFEIFREEGYDRRYRVVYFTELGEHDKAREIGRALDGEHVFDGFLDGRRMEEARGAIGALLVRLDAGEPPAADRIEEELGVFLVR
jgi:hypothetical protein